jgi:hypothetical protein
MGKPDLIGSAEVCEILGISRSGLTNLLAARKLSYVSRLGDTGPYMFERAEVLRHRDELAAKAAS